MAPPVLRREKHQLTLVIVRLLADVEMPRPGPLLQMVITNLRNRPLSETSISLMRKSFLSLYHNLITGSKAFPLVPYQGFFSSVPIDTPLGTSCDCCVENASPSPLMFEPAGLMVPPAGSRSSPKMLTPVLPEKAELEALKADSRNCVCTLEHNGFSFTRVISTVYSSDTTELTNCWRVTDYSADGHILMSVLCKFIRTAARYAVRLRGRKRKNTEEESSSSQSPPKKRLRL